MPSSHLLALLLLALLVTKQCGGFSCFPSYVPDAWEDDLDTVLNVKSPPETGDCDCGFDYGVVKVDSSQSLSSNNCWGSLLDKNTVITSAKCLLDFSRLTIQEHLLQPTSVDPVTVTLSRGLTPLRVECHEKAVPFFMISGGQVDYAVDICAIKLTSDGPSPLCLPAPSHEYNRRSTVFIPTGGSTPLTGRVVQRNRCGIRQGKKDGRICIRLSQTAPSSGDLLGVPVLKALRSGRYVQIGLSSYRVPGSLDHILTSDIESPTMITWIYKSMEGDASRCTRFEVYPTEATTKISMIQRRFMIPVPAPKLPKVNFSLMTDRPPIPPPPKLPRRQPYVVDPTDYDEY